MCAGSETTYLFAYGILRRGFWRGFLLDGCERVGAAVTEEQYALYVDTQPYATADERVSTLKGEVFAVDEQTLQQIDRLQGHPYWYRRHRIPVHIEGETITAWVYFSPKRLGKPIESGDLRDSPVWHTLGND